jgi:hypothetical protein
VTTWEASGIDLRSESSAKPQAFLRLFVFACLMTGLFGRFVYVCRPFDHDAAMFVYLGKSVCDGERFCHDVVDNKFPSVGLMTSVFWRAFGTYWPGYIFAQTLMCAAAVLMLARCAARNIGEHAGLPTALAAIVYLNFTVAVFGGFQLESIQVLFTVIAASSAIEVLRSGSRGDAFVVGLSAGCAAMLKPTGLAPLGALGLMLAYRLVKNPRCALHRFGTGKTLGLLTTVVSGLSIPAGVVITYMVSIDILRDMPALAREISQYAAHTPMHWTDIFKVLTVLGVAGFAVAVRGWVFRRHVDRTAPPVDRSVLGFAMAWFALEFLGGLMQRRMYGYHFLPVGAPAALMFGMLPRRDTMPRLAAALLPVMLLSIHNAREVLNYPDPRIPVLPVSEYLSAHASPGDKVWQDFLPRTLLETGLKPGARFPLIFIFGNYDSAPLKYTPILLGDFEQRKPEWIIVPTDVDAKIASEIVYCAHLLRSPERARNIRDSWGQIEHYVKSNYEPRVQIRGETVYRRKPGR